MSSIGGGQSLDRAVGIFTICVIVHETTLTGYVTPEWQSTLGYAYTDARVTSATSTTVVPGNRIQLVPLNQFSWWNKYQFTPVWSGALGVVYFSDSFASSDDSVKLPGFVRFDAAVYAKINEMWRAQANIENIFVPASRRRSARFQKCKIAALVGAQDFLGIEARITACRCLY